MLPIGDWFAPDDSNIESKISDGTYFVERHVSNDAPTHNLKRNKAFGNDRSQCGGVRKFGRYRTIAVHEKPKLTFYAEKSRRDPICGPARQHVLAQDRRMNWFLALQ